MTHHNTMEKGLNNTFFIFCVYFIQHFLAIVIWLYERNKYYAGDNRVEQRVSILLSSATEPLIQATLILTALRKCGPRCLYCAPHLGVLEKASGQGRELKASAMRREKGSF